jgi:hypothetical protein
MQKRERQKRTYIEDLVDEVREVFVFGALVSGCVGRELSGSGVQRSRETIEKGHGARSRQLARGAR